MLYAVAYVRVDSYFFIILNMKYEKNKLTATRIYCSYTVVYFYTIVFCTNPD